MDGTASWPHSISMPLPGIDLQDFPTVGFFFAVMDRELGWQALALQPDLPVMENPSLWAQLQLA